MDSFQMIRPKYYLMQYKTDDVELWIDGETYSSRRLATDVMAQFTDLIEHATTARVLEVDLSIDKPTVEVVGFKARPEERQWLRKKKSPQPN